MAKAYLNAMVLSVVLWLQDVPVAMAESTPEVMREQAGQSQDTPRSSRLRFRSGPICMCSDGLSEEEIEAAERKRLDAIFSQQEDTGR